METYYDDINFAETFQEKKDEKKPAESEADKKKRQDAQLIEDTMKTVQANKQALGSQGPAQVMKSGGPPPQPSSAGPAPKPKDTVFTALIDSPEKVQGALDGLAKQLDQWTTRIEKKKQMTEAMNELNKRIKSQKAECEIEVAEE